MRRLSHILLIFFFFGVFGLVTLRLFSPDRFDALWDAVFFHSSIEPFREDELMIAFADPLFSLNPTSFSASDRNRLINIYEPLVRTDDSLRLQPSLALSWGIIDDNTYEFRLRRGVRFHNGSFLKVDDVIASYEYARDYENSQIAPFLSSIESIQSIDDFLFRISLKFPDPLFLNKLTTLFIFPKETISDLDTQPIGTGPYRFVALNTTQNSLHLQRNEMYWGNQAKYPFLELRTILGKDERIDALKRGEIDILAAVPPSLSYELRSYDVDIKVKPSLEVNFLLFNFSDGTIFANRKVREAVFRAINKEELIEYTGTFTRSVNQFVNTGVFGNNPDIQPFEYDLEQASARIREIESFVRIPISVDLPENFEAFGRYLYEQLYKVGFAPEVNYFSPSVLRERMNAGDAQLYMFGWRSELGDSHSFLASVAHSKNEKYGQFNQSFYGNPTVDRLIEESESNMDKESRLDQLQEAMRILIEDDIFGVPLFESYVIYGVSRRVEFEPRIDGYIYAKDVL